jgi:uncharacterized protein involved in exopolysaccharide biosynthesis
MNNEVNSNNNIAEIIVKGKMLCKYMLSKWLLILFFAFISGIGGIVYAWLKKPIYTAEMTFTTDLDRSSQLGSYSSLAAQFGIDLGSGSNSAFEGDNLMELFKSRQIIEKVLFSKDSISNQLLIDDYLLNHEMRKSMQNDTLLKNVHFTKQSTGQNRLQDSIIGKIHERIIKQQLSIDRKDKKLSYIVIKMEDTNEEFAQKFVNQLASSAIEYYVDYKSKKARKNFDLINSQTDSIKGLLYGNIESIAQTNDLNVNPQKQIVRSQSQKIQVNATANAALYTELLKQLGLARVTLQRETPLIQIIDKPTLPLKKVKPGRFFTGIVFAMFGGIVFIICLAFFKWTRVRKMVINS